MAAQGPGFNGALGFDRSYYVATANPFAPAPRLAGRDRADVCVVGGGCTGLSAALHLAERGLSVVLLEGGRIGWGASGRNGGQLIPGLRLDAPALVARFGRERARALFDLALEARALVLDRIARHAIACDLKLTGQLAAAAKPHDLNPLQREAEVLAEVMDYPHVRLVAPGDIGAYVGSTSYHGGLIDLLGGHYHPLNYTLGLAEAARAAGVHLYEDSAAVRLGPRATVHTSHGEVAADRIVLAGDALLGQVAPAIAGHIMPVANYIVATEPLERPETLIAHDRAVSDTRFVVNYFRLSADGRLLFGGGERYTPAPPRDISAFAGAHMRRVFPQLAEARIDHAWGGLVSITRTRLPHLGQRGEVLFAQGYSGLGALFSTLAGKLIAEAVEGRRDRFDLVSRIAPPAFPGGARLRGPLHVLGMLWYALRDRL